MGNPTMPINLMLIARGFKEARQQQQQRAYKFGVSTSLSSTVAVEREWIINDSGRFVKCEERWNV